MLLAATSQAAVKKLNVEGLVAATFTPFNANFSVNYGLIDEQARYLNQTGVKWVYVTGTTGESLKLTASERMRIFEEWGKAAKKYSIGFIAHVGAESVVTARSLAASAQTAGAVAIGIMPPVFFKPGTVEALARTIDYVSQGAPNLPVYYYHIPSMTGVSFPSGMVDLVKMAGTLVPNLVGIKYTGLYEPRGLAEVQRIMDYEDGKYEVLTGRDEILLQCLETGVKGAVGSQYNFLGETYNAIIRAYNENKTVLGRKLQLLVVQFIYAIEDAVPSTVNGFKMAQNFAGLNVGDARLPSLPFTEPQKQAVKAAMAGWCTKANGVEGGAPFWCKTIADAQV